MTGKFLHGGSEKLFHEAVMVKPGLLWRLQDVEDARVMRFLPSKAAEQVWSQLKREKCSVLKSTKLKGSGDLKSPLTSHMEIQSLDSL